MPLRAIPSPLVALALALLAASGCKSFDLPASPEPDAPLNLEVSPLRLAPGGRLAIRFDLLSSAPAEVSVNGLPAELEGVVGTRQHWGYTATGDEGEILNVVVVVHLGSRSSSASIQAFLDLQLPSPPDPALLLLEARPPGETDQLSGLPGCVAGSDARAVRVCLDPAGKLGVGEAQVAADGSFPAIGLGDNAVARLFAFAVDEAGNASAPTAVVNDVEGPRVVSLTLSPRVPRTGRGLTVRVRFAETLGAPPAIWLRVGERQQSLPVSLAEGGEWEASTASVELPAGPALVTLESVDRAANSGTEEIPLAIAEPERFAPAALHLRRSEEAPVGWSIRGGAGAAPFPSQIEIALQAGEEPPEVCATRLAASDGSFDAAFVALQLASTDRVLLTAFDESGAELARATVAPDLSPPVLLEARVAPEIVGPAVPAEITVVTDEPLAPESSVTVAGRPAVRQPGQSPTETVFLYAVSGEEETGPADLSLRLLDPTGNVTLAEVPGAFTVDLVPPQVAFADAQGAWAPPPDPPDAFQPPAALTVTVDDALCGLASVAWSLVDLRTGGSWDGQDYVSADPPFEYPGAGSFPVALDQATPENERVELRVRAEDAVGNSALRRLALSRYADTDWTPIGPSEPGGVGLAMARIGETGLCVLAYRCRRGASCTDAWEQGRLAGYFSLDGGLNWEEPRDLGVQVTRGYPSVWRLEYDESGERGLAVGEGLLLRLGATCALDPIAAVAPGTASDFYSVAWDGATAWVAGEDGLYRSPDAGISWSKSTLGSVRFNGVTVVAPGKIIGVGTQAVVARTSDGGLSWAIQPLPGSSAELWDVGLDADGTILVGGDETLSRSVDGMFWQSLGYTSSNDWSIWRIRRSPAGALLRMLDRNVSWYRLTPQTGLDHLLTDVNTTETMDVVAIDGWAMFLAGSDIDYENAWSLSVGYSASGGF